VTMRALTRLATIVMALLVLSPTASWAHDKGGPGMGGGSRPHHRPAKFHHRPHHVFPCCLGGLYVPPAPPVVVVPPPTIYVVVPSPPDLVHVPAPRPEPAPEITLPTGRWARHGNGVDYPYTWVWVGPASSPP
jgi:hypothetical protein